MAIKTFPIGPLETNCYVVHNAVDAVVVDPGGDMRGGLTEVIDFLDKKKLTVQAIVLTHMHFDHILGVAALQKKTGVKVYASSGDDPLLQAALHDRSSWGTPAIEPFSYEPIKEGEYTFGSLTLQVLATPGHSQGSVCLYFAAEGLVVTGDLLFYHSIGRTDLPGSRHQDLIDSLQKKVYKLPPQTLAYPGHGPSTSVGDERMNNPFVRANEA